MIIKASERGGSNKLAKHLLNTVDNEQVEIHEVSGFMSSSLKSALHEAYVISQGTKCKNFLFSVSFNPPEGEAVPIAVFENTINRVEEKNGLLGQPRAIVFHEKEGRRHAHAVWSRIDSQKMKAVNLPFFKNRLMEISKALYLELGWKLPDGFINKENRNPLNFTLDQWQKANRLKDDPKFIKATLKESWSISNNKADFIKTLDQHGYYLAKGDRRGYVAIDWRGEVYSLSKWLDVKTKLLKEKLGDKEQLPSVTETKDKIDATLVDRVQYLTNELRQKNEQSSKPFIDRKNVMKAAHKLERDNLIQKQEKRWQRETIDRQARFNKGMRGFWDRITRKHNRILQQNELETYKSYRRDQTEKDQLIEQHLQQRGKLQQDINNQQDQHYKNVNQLKLSVFSHMPENKIVHLEKEFNTVKHSPSQNLGPEM